MYKALCAAVLLFPMFVLAQNSKPASSPTPFPSPSIVAKGKLLNQAMPIPTTTIFTPPQDGVYRLSVYATVTTARTIGSSSWSYDVGWTDDSGPQSVSPLLYGPDNASGQFIWNVVGVPVGGPVMVFQAKAGTPVTYVVNGPTDGASAYSLYYTLERLE